MSSPTELILMHMRESLPRFVSARPAMRAAAVTGVVVASLGALVSYVDMARLRESPNALKRYRFLVIALGAFVASAMLASAVRDYVYKVDSIRLNQQHYANTIWIREYRRALVG